MSSGWKVAATTRPWRTSTGSPRRRPSTSTSGKSARKRGARMKTRVERAEPRPSAVDRGLERVDLAAVGVALDHGVEQPQARLARDAPRARAGSRPRRCRGARRPARGRRAARRTTARRAIRLRSVVLSPPGIIRPGEAVESRTRRTSRARVPSAAQGRGVRREVALQRQDAELAAPSPAPRREPSRPRGSARISRPRHRLAEPARHLGHHLRRPASASWRARSRAARAAPGPPT